MVGVDASTTLYQAMANQAFDPCGEWDPEFHKEFSCGKNGGTLQSHREIVAHPGSEIPHETLIMVHEPLAVKDAIKIPEAKAALDKEWGKLRDQRVWQLETVCEYQDVKHKAIRDGRTVNFGRVYP